MLNEKPSLLLIATGLFVIFSLLARSLFYMVMASTGGEPTTDEGTTTMPNQLPSPPTPPPTEEDPPNILLIISDDQPFYTANYTPAIINEIFAKGTTFSDAFLTTSLCCPSRASILTGLYPYNHGVKSNHQPLTNTTFFEAIDNATVDDHYRTALVGRYLNSQSGDCRNEFDYWVAFPGGAPWYNGTNMPLNVNCEWMKFNNTYSTYLLRDYALRFLNDTISEGNPFAMWFSPFNSHAREDMNETHGERTPAPEDTNLYPNGLPSYYLPPSFNEADVSDKPGWVQEKPPVCQQDRPASECQEEYKKDQLSLARNLASLDRSVNTLLDFLDSKGELSNTLVIYINDNGLFQGEHRLFGKAAHYKESVKAIMGARWDDGHIPIGQSYELVGNIDIAPTIYDVLGLTPPYPLDGQSVLDLWRMNSSEPWRESILLEHRNHRDATIVTQSWSYTETKRDKSELYDRVNDPYELNNLWCSPDDPSCAYSDTITNLAAELRLLRPSWDGEPQRSR